MSTIKNLLALVPFALAITALPACAFQSTAADPPPPDAETPDAEAPDAGDLDASDYDVKAYEPCMLAVAKTVCKWHQACSDYTPDDCAKQEGEAMRGKTCTCDDAQLAACADATNALVCASTNKFGACGECFN